MSVITFNTRAHQRFAHLLREVTIHATDDDYLVIERIHAAVNAGQLAVRDAHATLVHLRHQQRQAA